MCIRDRRQGGVQPVMMTLPPIDGERYLSFLCRELTKLHEETVRTTLSRAVALYQEKEPRGEYVLVVAGAQRAAGPPVTLDQGCLLYTSRCV